MTSPRKVLPMFLFITLALIECCKTSVAFSCSAKGRTFRVADDTSLRFETQLHVAVGRLGKNRWGTIDGRNQDDVQDILQEVLPNLTANDVKPSLTRETTVLSYKNGDIDDHSSIASQPLLLMEDDVVCLPSFATQRTIPQLVTVAARPREIDLPIRHEQVLLDGDSFDPTETLIGRLGMVAAVVFFVAEVSTGMSIPEQVSWLMSERI